MINRRNFLALLSAVAVAPSFGAVSGCRKPKAVVVFYVDDLGYADTSTYGQKRVPCPNLDKLAAEGCRFTDAHSPTSVCTPSRYSLLTGDYAFRRPGTTILDGDAKLILPLPGEGKLTLPEMMRRSGYRTGVIGKWHLGLGRGGKSACWNDQDISDTLCRQADLFLKESAGENVFLYFCTSDVHVPRDPHSRFKGKTDLGIRGDQIVEMDDALGQIRASLKKYGYDDTLFIFTSDNGPRISDGYEDGARAAWEGVNPTHPFSGTKYGCYEGGTRVPFIVSWPGQVKPGSVSSALLSQTDISRTLAAILGVDVPDGSMLDSVNLEDVMIGGSSVGRKELVEQPGWGPVGFRSGDWKLICPKKGSPKLFNLADDPGETNDVAAKNPQLVITLKNRLKDIMKQP